MDVFDLRNRLVSDYESYITSFIRIRDNVIGDKVGRAIADGLLWPEPLIGLNPAFQRGDRIDDLVKEGILHRECERVFRHKGSGIGRDAPFTLHKHQSDAVRVAREGHNYVLTTGTGSGKSLAYIIPIVDHVLRHKGDKGIKAIIVYPMNALANSQEGELEKFLCRGYPDGKGPVTFARYTGQESEERKQQIIADPPHILLTNYVMLELILTRVRDRDLIGAANGLRFLVLDELHTYRGRQGADVAMLVRRAREAFSAGKLQCVGTSATLAGTGSPDEQRAEVARVASAIFGAPVEPSHVIGETLERATPERDIDDPAFVEELAKRLNDPEREPPTGYRDFISDPLSIWIEGVFGPAREEGTGRLARSEPISVTGPGGAAGKLSKATGLPLSRCAEAIQQQLLAAYYCEPNPETGFPAFAFRLHQFISRGDTVYASLEEESRRHVTLQGQKFVPGDRERILLPLVFCRECGQEYYCVRMSKGGVDAGIKAGASTGVKGTVNADVGDGVKGGTSAGTEAGAGADAGVNADAKAGGDAGSEAGANPSVETGEEEGDKEGEQGRRFFTGRELGDRAKEEESEAGFLYVDSTDPWPLDAEAARDRLPEDWFEEYKGSLRLRSNRKEYLPRALRIGADGRELVGYPEGGTTPDRPAAQTQTQGIDCFFIPAPFRFCLHCGVAYGFHERSDFAKLVSLDMGGRSTATTILSLSAIRYLRGDDSLAKRARKLLSFTDNRQDASLQAGHFNDFIEIGLLRSALYKAVAGAGAEGLAYDQVVQSTFDALDLPLELYAADPEAGYAGLEETNRALRSVLGYRLYHDLKRGWRVTAPNLEQCGLLEIKYRSLEDVCSEQEIWQGTHEALLSASPETRSEIAKTLLDFIRRELAIKVDYLTPSTQERVQTQSSQKLIPPWAIDDREKMAHSSVVFPRSVRRKGDYEGNVFLSGRSGFAQYLGRSSTFPDYHGRLSLSDKEEIIRQILEKLRKGGLTERVVEPKDKEDVPGYQLPASALVWVAGDGRKPVRDPIRMPRAPDNAGRANRFFVDFYKSVAMEGKGLEAREHTAQVQYELRIEREDRFREGRLPILYCSPTMELGVDISQLNVVNMRNIPPTPANYAQRSGRAGRSGQPALVFSYCSTYSAHDQYFFKRPENMVAGAVSPPRLDLANEDLIRAHVHSIWLAETGLDLKSSLMDILEAGGEEPTLALSESVRADVEAHSPRERALARAHNVLKTITEELEESDWYGSGWVEEVLNQVGLAFDRACDRWRGLYRAAKEQQARQNRIIIDASRTPGEKTKAKALRREAEAQLDLLTCKDRVMEADFYSYRYFASEGFLPGYSFPRLPLSAFIPGARRRKGDDDFLSRPRFLAIYEFGPRAIVYHEGSRYRISKVILPVEDRADDRDLVTTAAKQCGHCGYFHPISNGDGPDLCERCEKPLGPPMRSLFRLQNVSTMRVDRINSDEEERLRMGYEIKSAVRFAKRAGTVSSRTASVKAGDEELATLTYGDAATIFRVNLGWRRRKDRHRHGFVLDLERGYWAKSDEEEEDDEAPLSPHTARVIPYVLDRRNCLLIEPSHRLETNEMASLEAALKNAIQVEYELEDNELGAEPLPLLDDRRLILFFEAAEGGAGVLRRLVDDPSAIGRVARRALRLCHFDPDSGDDLRRAPRAREDCEAACYDCLMSYVNQHDHPLLDRHSILDALMGLSRAVVERSPAPEPRAEHLERLMRQCGSDLEREWLRFLQKNDLSLPERAQEYVEQCRTRPDFVYQRHMTAVYVDGPHHEFEERHKRDMTQTECMEDMGYTVLRFAHRDDWVEIVARHPDLFGRIK